MMAEHPTTQRAYTLRLRGVPGDNSWREHLWRTHEAVNRGAQVFGDWLLTLRGGLSHELADEDDIQAINDSQVDEEFEKQHEAALEKKRKLPTRDAIREQLEKKRQQNEEARRKRIAERQVVLALSWLSVESGDGKPMEDQFVVALGTDNPTERSDKVKNALRRTDLPTRPSVSQSASGCPSANSPTN